MVGKAPEFFQKFMFQKVKGFFQNPAGSAIAIVLDFYSLISTPEAPAHLFFLFVLGLFSILAILLLKWKIIKLDGLIQSRNGKLNPFFTIVLIAWILGIASAITLAIMGLITGIVNLAQLLAQIM